MYRNNKAVEFNKLKRKLDDLTVEHKMLIGYLSLIEEAVIQEFRQYVNPRSAKRHCCPSSSSYPPRSQPYSRSSSQRTRKLCFSSPSPLSPPASSSSSQSSPASSPLLTPLHERLLPSLISRHTTSPV